MKCADSEEIARSASAKVRRFGGWPVARCLLSGSSSASPSGLRARIRRNNPSSVGDALVWITGSLRLRLRPLPPGLRPRPFPPDRLRQLYPIPARDPLLSCVKQRDSVEALCRRQWRLALLEAECAKLARLQRGRDQDV